MFVLASLAVLSLTSVCVCVCSFVGMSILHVESSKFEGSAMVNMSTFISGSACSAMH